MDANVEKFSSSAAAATEVTVERVAPEVPRDGMDVVGKVELEDMAPSLATMVMEGTEVVADVVEVAAGMMVMAEMMEMEGTGTSGVMTATAETGEGKEEAVKAVV